MIRAFARPVPLVLLLAFCTAIPIVMALVRMVQIPLGQVPQDSLRLMAAPIAFWLHAVGGASFGILGPVQFARVLRNRFGRLHRVLGRVFAFSGLLLGLGGLVLLLKVQSISTDLLLVFRGLAGLALILALGLGIAAARARDIPRHRAWMIRAYAIGMGTGTIALVYFPIYLIRGEEITGLANDAIFVGWWSLNILFAEWIIRRYINAPRALPGPLVTE